MKTIKQTIADNSEYKSLINAVMRNINKEDIQDVANYGADRGFNGFTWYNDTHKFAISHRKTIIKLLEQQAESMDLEVVEMVSNFGVFRQSKMDSDDKKDLYRYLGGCKTEQGAVTNVMAWFALEEVCRMFED